MTGPADPNAPPDCTACGACCRYAGEVVVDRLDPVPRELTRPASARAASAAGTDDPLLFMARAPDGRCIALQGELGGRCRCAVYERRPAACRDFQPGSIACRGARSALFG